MTLPLPPSLSPFCPLHSLTPSQVHDGTYTPADQFLKDPDSLCSTVTWKDEEDRVIWVYRIQVRKGGGRGEGGGYRGKAGWGRRGVDKVKCVW